MTNKDYTKPILKKYVVSWWSSLDPVVGCKKPDSFKYCRIPISKSNDKLTLQAIIEASSSKELKGIIVNYFPDYAELTVRPYNSEIDKEIEKRIELANSYGLKPKNIVESPRTIIPNLSPLRSFL